MIRSLAGRVRACLALLVLLSPCAIPAWAGFSADSCLGAEEQNVKTGGTSGVRAVVSGDLNGDCNGGAAAPCMDVVTASAADDRIAWFENDGMDPPAFTRIDISTDADGATAVFVADLDDDGALDVLSASANDNKIAWYRNNGFVEPGFTELVISTDAELAQAVFAADIDGDGELDVLSASFADNKIAWYENDGNDPPEFTENIVSASALGASSVYAADMDGDGDMDILSASVLDDKVAWYEQRPATGNPPQIPWVEHVITPTGTLFNGALERTRPVSVIAADLDGNCDPKTPAACMDVAVAFNGEVALTGKITWFRNDGMATPGFAPHDILTGLRDARQVLAADLENDGALDLLAAYEDKITWFQNDGAEMPLFTPNEVAQALFGATGVNAADLDDDGFLDIQSASSAPGVRVSDDKVLWYRNDGLEPPEFPLQAPISLNASTPQSIAIADIDDNCDPDEQDPGAPCMDVVSGSSADNTVAWYGNGGQTPLPLFTQAEIATDADGVLSVFVADLDGNCPADPGSAPPGTPCLDVVAAAPGNGIDGKIVWYANDGATPTPGFSTEIVILQGAADMGEPTDPPTSDNAQPMSVFAADINGDCATVGAGTPCIDVIAAIRVAAEDVDDKVSWFENLGGEPPTFEEHVITTNLEGPRAVFAADINGDCQTVSAGTPCMDVLVASTDDDKITWYRSTGTTDPELDQFDEIEITALALGAMYVSAADLDGDCQDGVASYCMEVLTASSRNNTIAWFAIDQPAAPDPPPERAVGPGGSGAPASTTGEPPVTEPTLSVEPSLLEFGDVFAGQTEPATLPLIIANIATSGEDLEITSIESTGLNFAPSPTELTLPPGDSQEITVIFVPTAIEDYSGTLEFTSNAVNDPSPTVEMTGAGLQFIGQAVASDRVFARFVSAGDVDDDGRLDILAASSGDGVIAAYLQQEPDPEAEDPAMTFQQVIISPAANDARAAYVVDLNADGAPDVTTAFFFEIAWHEGGVIETCNSFDVDGDERMAGAELGWIWTSFGERFPGAPDDNDLWWKLVDFNRDGTIDGDDLAIGTSLGVWTLFVSPQEGDPQGPLCNYTCVSQD